MSCNLADVTVFGISAMPGKGGLGREVYVKEKVEEKKVQETRRFEDFRQRKHGAFSERRLEADLRKSQRSCEQLDSAKVFSLYYTRCDSLTVWLVQGIEAPQETYFWPAELMNNGEEEDEEEEEEEEDEDDVGGLSHFMCVGDGFKLLGGRETKSSDRVSESAALLLCLVWYSL